MVESQTRLIQFMGTLLIALFLTWLIKDASFTVPQEYVLFLLLFSIGLWVTEAIPPFAVGILIIGFLVFFLGQPAMKEYDIDVGKFVDTWADSVIWLHGGTSLQPLRANRGKSIGPLHAVT